MEHQARWNDKRIDWRESFSDFRAILDRATDERPLQQYLAEKPALLAWVADCSKWCWDRPKFGNQLIPDFLVSRDQTNGYAWTMIELESPLAMPITRAGRKSHNLERAHAQIRQWRVWLRKNYAYVQDQLGFTGLSSDARAVIIIGRRSFIPEDLRPMWGEFSDSLTSVMTYDRLLDFVSLRQEALNASHYSSNDGFNRRVRRAAPR